MLVVQVEKDVAHMHNACQQLRASQPLADLILGALDCANFLNQVGPPSSPALHLQSDSRVQVLTSDANCAQGNKKPAAVAFNLEFLGKLKDIKATVDASNSLLHFLLQQLQTAHPALRDHLLSTLLPALRPAATLKMKELSEVVRALDTCLKPLQQLVAASKGHGPPCLQALASFLPKAQQELAKLKVGAASGAESAFG